MALLVTNVAAAILAGLACFEAFAERTSPAWRRKFLTAGLAVLVTAGTLYLRYRQGQEMAFVKAAAAMSLHAMAGGL